MSEIDGVETSFANEAGTLVRVSLRPGADREKVAREVNRILSEESGDRVPLPSGAETSPGTAEAVPGGQPASAALEREKWRDSAQVARQAEAATLTARRRLLVLALLVGCVLVFALLWWRRRRRRDEPSRPQAAHQLIQ
jgi:hypothetical protein